MGCGKGIGRVALGLQRLQRAFQLGKLGAGRSLFIERSGFFRSRRQDLAQACQTGAGRKQQLTQFALALHDGISAVLQRLVIERKHRAIGLTTDAAQRAGYKCVVDRRAAGVDEAAAALLQPDQFMGGPIDLQLGTDAHRAVGVQEVIGRLRMHPEQKIEERGERRRLAGFVEAVDNVKIRPSGDSLAEVDDAVGEFTVAREIKAIEAHQLSSRSAALMRAEMSSVPLTSSPSMKRSKPD